MDLAPDHQPHPPAPKVINGLSVDVEDWFQVGAFETTIARGDWDGCELRVESNVETILALFERAGVKATFFTLGWIAERHPDAAAALTVSIRLACALVTLGTDVLNQLLLTQTA